MTIENDSAHSANQSLLMARGPVVRWLTGTAVVVILVGIYLLLKPIDLSDGNFLLIPVGAFLLTSYWAIFAVAITRLRQSRYPVVDGLILLVILLALLLLGFAYLYQSLSAANPASFTTNIETKIAAVYFSVTTLSTVGYGEISPGDDMARGITMTQMLLDLTVLGLGVKLLSQASKHRLQTLTVDTNSSST